MYDLLIDIFIKVDDFYNLNKNIIEQHCKDKKRKRLFNGKGLHIIEIITIETNFHYSGVKTFKQYYKEIVLKSMRIEFPNLISYERFIELRNELTLIFQQLAELSTTTDSLLKHFIDSFHIKACRFQRRHSHKTLKSIAAVGYTSLGEFYGMKLHVISNLAGSFRKFLIMPGNIVDNNHNLIECITKDIFGKIYGDKGYLLKQDFKEHLEKNNNVSVVAKHRGNMKNTQSHLAEDQKALKKRGCIESIGNILKNILGLEYTYHRSVRGFFSHVFSVIFAYSFYPKKPSVEYLNRFTNRAKPLLNDILIDNVIL